MKYVCLGYVEANEWEKKGESEQIEIMGRCFAYDDVLRKNGHFAGGEVLQSPQTARTLRWKNGKVRVIDGPFAETKESIGGILLLEANDMEHAIELMSKHPAVKVGPYEIRPASELAEVARNSAGK